MDDGSHYGFQLPHELTLLRDQIRRFMREEVKPIEDKLPHDAIACAPEDLARLRGLAAEMGLTRLTTPEQYGGNALSALARTVVAEESAKCRAGAYNPALGAFAGGPPVIVWSGTPRQIEKYAIPCIDGARRAYVAITEPTGGSDPRNNVQTRAHKEGDVWLLNGRKMWISAAASADYGVVFARTRDGAPPQITAFIVEPSFKGIEFNEIKVLRKPSPYEIVFDNCEVPAENVLGEVGGGFGVAQNWLVGCADSLCCQLHRDGPGGIGHGLRVGQEAAGARRSPCRQAGDSVDDRRLRSGAAGSPATDL